MEHNLQVAINNEKLIQAHAARTILSLIQILAYGNCQYTIKDVTIAEYKISWLQHISIPTNNAAITDVVKNNLSLYVFKNLTMFEPLFLNLIFFMSWFFNKLLIIFLKLPLY